MLSLSIPENKSAIESYPSDYQNLTDKLTYAGIGIWSADTYQNSFTVCSLGKSILGISTEMDITLTKALKLLSFSYLRKVFYSFYTGFYSYCPVILEIRLENKIEGAEDKWICLTGKFNPDSKQFSGLIYDITERKNCEINTSVFIAKLNHELRSPLSTIKLYTQQGIKIATKENSKIATVLEKADQQINRMNGLIEDFLLVSTTDSRKILLKKTSFFIKDVLEEAISNFCEGKCEHKIFVDITNNLILCADRGKIIQVLNNYISNAIKYAPPESRIIITGIKDDNSLRISVRDFGDGVSPAEQKKLFHKYYRCPNTLGIQGYGIGLFVVREIIEAHHGRFGITSEVGKGAEFYFTLPLTV